MSAARAVREEVDEVEAVARWRHELHELCQPLTRLQWRLEIGQREGDEAALRETIEGCLAEAREMAEWVQRMRAQLARMAQPAGIAQPIRIAEPTGIAQPAGMSIGIQKSDVEVGL